MIYKQKKYIYFFILAIAQISLQAGVLNSKDTSNQVIKVPKNIIILIADGWGYNLIQATDFWSDGKSNSAVYENFPIKYFMSTFPGSAESSAQYGYSSDNCWEDFNYVLSGATDSAPAATTMASGKKSIPKTIGMDIYGNEVLNITTFANSIGKSTGLVTSVPISHATPAGFSSHNSDRNNYSEIAREMLLDTKIQVIMGCGNPLFDDNHKILTNPEDFKYVGDKVTWEALSKNSINYPIASNKGNTQVQDVNSDGKPDSWTLIQTKNDFVKLIEGPTPLRVCGIAECASVLPVHYIATATTSDNNLISDLPTLQEMSLAAINVLDENPLGFFLMIEGGAVDWANHENNKSLAISEMVNFNQTVNSVIKWVETKSNWDETLIIVTGDHETGYITGPLEKNANPFTNPVLNKGKGTLPTMKYNYTSHTNQLIPIYVKGAGSNLLDKYADQNDKVFGKYIDNTELGNLYFELWKK